MNTVIGEAKTVASDSMRSRDGHARREEDRDHRKPEIKLLVTGNKTFGYRKSVFFYMYIRRQLAYHLPGSGKMSPRTFTSNSSDAVNKRNYLCWSSFMQIIYRSTQQL